MRETEWFDGRSMDEKLDRYRLRRFVGGAIVVLLLAGVAMCATQAHAQETPALVVATPELQGPYSGSVILAAPFPLGGHVGVILNRPSTVKMADLFPEHEPSKNVVDPVYFGGPEATDMLFALVKGEAPDPKAIELAQGIWLVGLAAAIDHIIETTPNDARYYAGTVYWKPGELAEELKKGYFVLRPVDRGKLYLQDTGPLYEQLAPKKGQVDA